MYRSDPKLVQACLEGKPEAWNTLVERYSRLVYSIPRRYGMSEHDAEDAFQGVFLNLYRSLDRLKDQTRLSAWLITTTHRECWRIGRERNRPVAESEHFESVAEPPDDRVAAWERQQAVHEALGELGGRCERLLRALFLDKESPSYEEIAHRMGMRPGSIGPTRARCFERLMKVLNSMGIFDCQDV